MTARTRTDYIVIHCAATRAGMDVGAKEIGQWHRARGWNGIGYHWVIRRDGAIERGRAESQVGAHVENHNHNSVGVCMVGGLGEGKGWPPENNFTDAQWASLKRLCLDLLARYPGATILGHRDFPGVAKACPSFDARAWAMAEGLPASKALRGLGTVKGQSLFGTSTGVSAGAAEYGAQSLEGSDSGIEGALGGVKGQLTELAASGLRFFAILLFVVTVIAFAIPLCRLAWQGILWLIVWWRGDSSDDAAPAAAFGPGDVPPVFVAAPVKRKRKAKKRKDRR